MGMQIHGSRFSTADFEMFKASLRKETATLARWFIEKRFDNQNRRTGIELEFWLADGNFLPAPENEKFLHTANHTQIVPELSKFNAELNSNPVDISANCLRNLRAELEACWRRIQRAANTSGLNALMIGSLPTLREPMLGIENLSSSDRYSALNEQVMRLREGRPLSLDIDGKDHLISSFHDIMLESAATSMQVHFQVEADAIVRHFNASLIASAAVVALSANSPYLFGKDLWDETRIPIFEQAVRLPSFDDPDGMPVPRVGFGSGYVRESLFELFLENLNGFPILLPVQYSGDHEWLNHLRLHNGNIWRWNRPILGLGNDAAPHLRIEHRTPASGPTLDDVVANAAFYLGLTHWLATLAIPPEEKLPFAVAKNNFYEGARRGLAGRIVWLDGKTVSLQTLIHEQLVDAASDGLHDLGVNETDVHHYLGEIIRERARSGRTGASWQRAFISTHGMDFQSLTARYFELQESGAPVHTWTV